MKEKRAGRRFQRKVYPWTSMPLDKNRRMTLCFLVVSLLGVTSPECQQISDNVQTITDFQTMTIDPGTLTVKLDGLLPLLPAPNRDFYQRFRGNVISIAHLGPDGSNISYNAFAVDSDGRLVTRSKSQVLMRGPYGTVFAESTYYYGSQYNHQPTDFHAALYFNEGSHEPAQKVGIINEVGVLSAISLVRVFRAPPEFLVVCATYDPAGRLLVLSVNGSKNGNWVHSNEIQTLYPDLDVATVYVDRPKTREYFGLPETFPVVDYLKKPQNRAHQVALAIDSDTVNLHYQRNRYMRQDVFGTDGSHTTEFFKYAVTPEDRQLELVDEQIKFGR